MKNKIETSIIIRTRNHKKLLKDLLKKIKQQKRVFKPEIVVVDSSSIDGTAELAKKQGCKVIKINPKSFSHSYTLNLGAENSKNEILVYVSVDIIPEDNLWLFHLVKHFKDKKVGGVFGRQKPIPNFNPIEEFKTKKMFQKNKSIALFSCASGAIRKSLWKKIKFDKMLYNLMGGQDQKWAIDANKGGYKIIYEPKSVVYHSHKYSPKSRIKEAYQIGFYKKEFLSYNKNVRILDYKKRDLVKYLIKRKKFKELIWDLIIIGIIMRFAAHYGQFKRKVKTKIS
jgi:rhamnosyltransferase